MSSVLRTLQNTVWSDLPKGMETILPVSKITAGDSEGQNKKQARGINLWPAKMLGRGGWI